MNTEGSINVAIIIDPCQPLYRSIKYKNKLIDHV